MPPTARVSGSSPTSRPSGPTCARRSWLRRMRWNGPRPERVGDEAGIEIGEQFVAFDVFRLRDRVVGEYRDYVESFVHIYDQRIEGFVREKLDEGELWPDAVLQLNPAYEPGPTLGELAAKGELH